LLFLLLWPGFSWRGGSRENVPPGPYRSPLKLLRVLPATAQCSLRFHKRDTTYGTMPEWPPRVLIVDDEHLVVETIAAALDEEYSVSIAGTVADAVRRLRETEFAVVLLDCLLPDGDAREVIAAAEAREAAVILMSGDPEWIETFSADHRLLFLAKPFSMDELQKTLGAVLT
jgi:CheY-like chemotaxis protein